MPRTVEQNERARASRRQQILAAAIPAFAASGYSRAKISDIAREAGASHGAVFLSFPSKDDLFRSAVLEPLADLETVLAVPGPEAGSPLARLRRMAREHVAAVARLGDYLRLTQYVLGQRQRFPELADRLFAFSDRFVARLVPLIREGQAAHELAPGDAVAAALAYFAYLNGIGLVILDPDEPYRERLADLGVRLFGPTGDRG